MAQKIVLSIAKLRELAVRLPDPRRQTGNKQHNLADVLVITLMAIISGKQSWDEISWYAQDRAQWLREKLGVTSVPSDSTIQRVMGCIRPEALEEIYRQWILPAIRNRKNAHFCVDGKTVCGVENNGGAKLHEVSVWMTRYGLALGQTSTSQKSNEITVIPQLLDDLDIEGGVVSIDAMGCQKDIARNILKNGADYILAMKKNQLRFYEQIAEYFAWAQQTPAEARTLKTYQEVDYGHGRRVKRRIAITRDVKDFPAAKDWEGIQSIIMVETSCSVKGKETKDIRYFISSLSCSAPEMLRRIREHWSIENSLHWVLDTQFGEDKCKVHARNAATNLSLLRKIAMALIKLVKGPATTYTRIQQKAANIPDYILDMF